MESKDPCYCLITEGNTGHLNRPSSGYHIKLQNTEILFMQSLLVTIGEDGKCINQ